MSNLPVLLIRGSENDRDVAAIAALGIDSVDEAFPEISPGKLEDAQELLMAAEHGDGWLVITSRNSMKYWSQLVGEKVLRETLHANSKLKFAAIGNGCAQTLLDLGIDKFLVPERADSDHLLKELRKFSPSDLIFPAGNLSRTTLTNVLSQLGWKIHSKVVYINSPKPVSSEIIERIQAKSFSAIVLRSPSSVTALHAIIGNPPIPLIFGGPITAQSARELGMEIAGIASDPSPESLANMVNQILERGSK